MIGGQNVFKDKEKYFHNESDAGRMGALLGSRQLAGDGQAMPRATRLELVLAALPEAVLWGARERYHTNSRWFIVKEIHTRLRLYTHIQREL